MKDLEDTLLADDKIEGNVFKDEKKSVPLCAMFKLRYYQQYFQVTTGEVMLKLIWSIVFIFNKFVETASDKTDLYGPFWIYCTIVFSLAVSQN